MPVEIKYNGSTIANLEGGQTATLPCRGKKMKSDLTVIAPEGSGGECSGKHIIEVYELPAEGVEGAIYSKTSLTDLIMVMQYGVMSLAEMYGVEIPSIIATAETFPTIEPNGYMLCYVPDIQKVYMNNEGAWVDVSTAYGDFLGEISNKNEADPSTYGYYVALGNVLYQYTNGQYNRLVKKGGLLYTSNGDGTCYVSGIEKYHDEEIYISSTSPNGETVTGIDFMAFSDAIFNTLTIPNTITFISTDSFTDALCNKIILNEGITEISNQAFRYANCLEYTLPNTLTNIGAYAFQDNRILVSITIPASVKNIGDYAFMNCWSLKAIMFSGTVEQWNAITLGNNWYTGNRVTKVTCSDGEVAL